MEIVAVSDLDEKKCRTFCSRWEVPRYYPDYKEMIEKEQPDIVSIATAAGLHAEMAIFAMEHGVKGIYCEKALSCSLAEADAIVECVAQYNVSFMLGAQRWSGDPGCLTYTARLTNGVFISHLPAVTDMRWEAVCSIG